MTDQTRIADRPHQAVDQADPLSLTTQADYPHLRQQPVCPLCHHEKDHGLLVCWTCYRRLDLRNSLAPYARTILEQAETDARHAAQGRQLADTIATAVYGRS